MTEVEKIIYNNFLEVSKKVNNKPVKYRKNFDNFPDENYIIVSKLSNFFYKFKHLKIKDFFEAPYFVYDENYFDLKFYLSPKAIKAYTLYNDKFLLNNPDNVNTLSKMQESIKFIYNYCKENNINIKDYLAVKEGEYNVFMKHIKNRDVIIFILFAFNNFEKVVRSIDTDIKTMYSSNFSRLNYIRTKYYSSSKAKKIINKFKIFVENQKV
mgnify:FL=1|tara:strand:- start:5013 stop:5645 length:633 start_codon:yes stop_codon:yes gene_type:complete